MENGSKRATLVSLFAAQKLAVLSTYAKGQPYLSLVAFAATQDLKSLFLATGRTTRKFENILEHPRIAMLVDNRSNRETDFEEACAATILAEAFELSGEEKKVRLKLYLEKHPYLEEFAASSQSALVEVRVQSIVLVERFEETTTLEF
jgi:nitroimidazol reductase NimA-like FMN-containing flavoprotein (pyridoxamine 5'-phosphate oxidase superfamily)